MTIGLTITALGFLIWLRYMIPGIIVLWGSRGFRDESQQIIEKMKLNTKATVPSMTDQELLDSMVEFDVLKIQHDALMEQWLERNEESSNYISKQLYGLGLMWAGVVISIINAAIS